MTGRRAWLCVCHGRFAASNQSAVTDSAGRAPV